MDRGPSSRSRHRNSFIIIITEKADSSAVVIEEVDDVENISLQVTQG